MVLATAGSLLAADPKDEVTNAAKKLGDAANYSWKQTTENAGGGGGGGGFGGLGGAPVDGKTEKAGLSYTSSKVNFQGDEMTIERLSKGTNSAMNRGEGWQTMAEMMANFGGGGGGGGRRGGGFNQAIMTPAMQAQDIVKQVQDLKESGGAYVGDLTEDGAKTLAMPFGRGGRRGGGGGGGGGFTPPEVTGAKGSVSFWVKDGMLSKYVLKVQGKMTFNDNDIDINRTTTVEIKDVGATKINVPDDIKKKLE
jgi:hypothetical protein